jgi:glycosyltransferase involved in cell wall biosynthesis
LKPENAQPAERNSAQPAERNSAQPADSVPARPGRPLRLAIAAPRFWPLVEDVPTHVLRLAESLIAAGHTVTVVTPQWKRAWPRQMVVGTVPLVRLSGSLRGGLSTVRWMYGLSRWLREERFGGLLVAGLRHEAYVALGAAQRSSTPVVLLAGEGDVAWQRTAAFGTRIAARCLAARAIVAPSEDLADELTLAGYSPHSIRVIPRRVPIAPPRSPLAREAARAALAAVNYDLATTEVAPVALAVGRLDEQSRFGDLVRAWRIVSARRSEARLWILGDGPLRERLFRQISDLDLRFRVLIPGTFDGLREILQAADLFLDPAPHRVPPLALLEALASGLPVACAPTAALIGLVGAEASGMFFPSGDIQNLAAKISEHFEHPAAGILRASTIRQQLQQAPTPADEAAAYVDLFQRLGNRSPVDQTG